MASGQYGGGSQQLYYHYCSGRIPGHTTRAPPVGFNWRPTASSSMPLPTWTRQYTDDTKFQFESLSLCIKKIDPAILNLSLLSKFSKKYKCIASVHIGIGGQLLNKT